MQIALRGVGLMAHRLTNARAVRIAGWTVTEGDRCPRGSLRAGGTKHYGRRIHALTWRRTRGFRMSFGACRGGFMSAHWPRYRSHVAPRCLFHDGHFAVAPDR